jgi:phosphoglycerate dehydrogenase-like enzyme
VVCSSHVAGVTKEASRTASLQVTAEMLRVLRGEMPDVLVNPEVKARLGLK